MQRVGGGETCYDSWLRGFNGSFREREFTVIQQSSGHLPCGGSTKVAKRVRDQTRGRGVLQTILAEHGGVVLVQI